MPSTKPQVKAVITVEQKAKLEEIANKEQRSVSNLLKFLIAEKIETYEKQHGTIKIVNIGNDNQDINITM